MNMPTEGDIIDKDYKYTAYNNALQENAHTLRRNMTKQEKRLWYQYLNKYPLKFYRQRPIDRYIADFYCSAAKLVIELDGSQHFLDEEMEYDSVRTEILERYDLYVLRFTNREIDRDFDRVCRAIDTIVQSRVGEDPSTTA